VNISAQDALTADYNCETGCIDLNIEGGMRPFEVEWLEHTQGQQYSTISGWPKTDLNGADGKEDLCNIPNGEYKVLVTDAFCRVAELKVNANPCKCISVSLDAKENVSWCNGVEPDIPGSTANETCDGSLDINIDSQSPYTVSWTGPNGFSSNSEDISNLCTGLYRVSVRTQDCERKMAFVICCCNVGLESPGEPGFTLFSCTQEGNTPPISIEGEVNTSNGGISITNLGGSNPSLIWTGPNGFTSKDKDLTGLENGTYCLRAFDGCSEDEVCFEMIDCEDIPITFTVIEPCPEFFTEPKFDGIITLNNLNLPGYSYENIQWSNGSSGQILNEVSPGLYTVTITINESCDLVKEIDVITTGDQSLYSNVVLDDCLTIEKCRNRPFDNIQLPTVPIFAWNHFACQQRDICPETNTVVTFSPWASVEDGFVIFCSSPYKNDYSDPEENFKCDYFGDCPLDDVVTNKFLFSGKARCITCTEQPGPLNLCDYLVECSECIDWGVWPIWCRNRFHCGQEIDVQPCGSYDGCECIGNEQIISDCGDENVIQFIAYETDSTSYIAVTQVTDPITSVIQKTMLYLIDHQMNVINTQEVGGNSLINVKSFDESHIYSFGTLIAKIGGPIDIDQSGKDAYITSSLSSDKMYHYNGVGDQTISDIEKRDDEIYAIGSYSKSFSFESDEPKALENEGESRLLMFNATQKEIILTGNDGTIGEKITKTRDEFIISGRFSDKLELNNDEIATGSGIFIGQMASDKLEWTTSFTSNNTIHYTNIIIDNDVLYLSISGNQILINNQMLLAEETSVVIALDKDSGALLWSKNLLDFGSFRDLKINDLTIFQSNLILSGSTSEYGAEKEKGGVFIKLDLEGNFSETKVLLNSDIVENSKFIKSHISPDLIYTGINELNIEDCDDRLFASTISFGVDSRNLTTPSNSFKYLYPNPAKDILFVSNTNKISKISIFSTNGKSILEIKNDKKDIDISDLSAGVYFARIKLFSGDIHIEKIIIL
jgi:hypothetical protein